jgi:hypothetical protein
MPALGSVHLLKRDLTRSRNAALRCSNVPSITISYITSRVSPRVGSLGEVTAKRSRSSRCGTLQQVEDDVEVLAGGMSFQSSPLVGRRDMKFQMLQFGVGRFYQPTTASRFPCSRME